MANDPFFNKNECAW